MTLKFGLSNAKPSASLRRLVERQGARLFVEQFFRAVTSACGMADHQVRRLQAWQHHMALVPIATMFLVKERRAHRETAELLSCRDLLEIMRIDCPPGSSPTKTSPNPSSTGIDGGAKPWSPPVENKPPCSRHQTERQSDKVELQEGQKAESPIII